MKRQEFKDLLVFAQILLEHFNISKNTVGVGVLSFSTGWTGVVELADYKNKSEVQDKIIEIVQDEGVNGGRRTDLYLGIKNAKDQLEGFRREGVAKIIVILMEGNAQSPEDAVIEAEKAKQRNITITFVNIHRRDDDLKQHGEIVSPPKEQYLFPVNSFQDLFVIHRPLAQRICEGVCSRDLADQTLQTSGTSISNTVLLTILFAAQFVFVF